MKEGCSQQEGMMKTQDHVKTPTGLNEGQAHGSDKRTGPDLLWVLNVCIAYFWIYISHEYD